MLFSVRQKLRFTLPVGIVVVSLGINATVGAVGALRIAELVTACGRSTVIAANHLEANGAGKIRLAADAFRMTNDFLALLNHYNDGVRTSYLYNGFWGGFDTAAFVQHLQAMASDAAVSVEPVTEQEAEDLAARTAQLLLCDVLPAVETAASVALAVDGMLDKPEHKKLRTCLQSLTSLSRVWQVYLTKRTTPETQMYLIPAVAHTVLTLWELFRDLNPQKGPALVVNPENQKAAVAVVEKSATTAVDHTAVGGNSVGATTTVTSGAVTTQVTPLADKPAASTSGLAHPTVVVTDITGHEDDDEADALELVVEQQAEQKQASTDTTHNDASVAPVTNDAKAPEVKEPVVEQPLHVVVTPPAEEKSVVSAAPAAGSTDLLNPPQGTVPVTVVSDTNAGEKQAEVSTTVSTGGALTSESVVLQPSIPVTGRVSPRAQEAEEYEAIGVNKPPVTRHPRVEPARGFFTNGMPYRPNDSKTGESKKA